VLLVGRRVLSILVLSALLRGPIKMGNAVVTMKIMPDNPEVDLVKLEEEAKEIISDSVGEGEMKVSQEPVAFGLMSLDIVFVMDETSGSPDPIAEKVSELDGVNSAEISDVRRAIG